MGIKSIQKILLIIIILGFAFAFSSPTLYKSLDLDINENFWGIVNLGLPLLVVLLMGITLFSSQRYKNIRMTGSALKKLVNFILISILIGITFIISWIVLFIIGFSNGSYLMSTYGTPIHRPRIK